MAVPALLLAAACLRHAPHRAPHRAPHPPQRVQRRALPPAAVLLPIDDDAPSFGEARPRKGRSARQGGPDGGVESEKNRPYLSEERHLVMWREAQELARLQPVTASMKLAMVAAQQGDSALAITIATRALALKLESGQQPDVRSCNQLLREVGDSGRTEEMMDFFKVMQLAGVEPTQVTYGTLISRAGSSRRPILASQCFRDMLRRGIEPDAQAFNSLINAFAKIGDVAKAFRAADAMRKRRIEPTLVTYNTLIDACARSGNLTRAETTLSQMVAAKHVPNERTYSILINACARQARLKEAFDWLGEMRAAGLSPNAVTWSALINACCRSSQVDRAFQILAEMKAAGFTPNVITYTTLIDGCAKAGQPQRALSVLRQMRRDGIEPNRITCHALFSGFLKQGEVLLAREVLQHMAAAGYRPGAMAFTALLTSASKLGPRGHSAGIACLLRQMLTDGSAANGAPGMLDKSIELLEERKYDGDQEMAHGTFDKTLGVIDALRRARVQPTRAIWNHLFEHVTSFSQLDEALERYKGKVGEDNASELDGLTAARNRLALSEWEGFGSPPMLHQPFLAESTTPPKPELVGAFQVFNEMRRSGIQADRAAYNALINACSSAADVVRAEGAFGEMVAAGIKPDVISYTSLVKAYTVAGDTAGAERIFVEMQQRTNHFTTFTPPSSYTFAHLMAANRRAGNATRVHELLDDMIARELQPSAAHLSTALQACEIDAADESSLSRALTIYEMMTSEGIRLDTRSLLAFDRVCRMHNRPDIAANARRKRSMASRAR